MKIVSIGGGALDDYHGGSGNYSYNKQVTPQINIELFPDYLGESDKLSELSKDTKSALLLAFAFNDTLSEYAEEDLIVMYDDYLSYIEPKEKKEKIWGITISKSPKSKSKKLLFLGNYALGVISVSKPFHVYKIDSYAVLFVKPGCPGIACNLFEGKLFVPRGTPVLLGKNSGLVYEYDPENMEKLLEKVRLEVADNRVNKLDKTKLNPSYNYTNFVTKSVNVKTTPQRLIYKEVSRQNVIYDVRQENAFLCLDVSRESCVKIDSSNGKKVSLYVESLSFDSTIVCGSNVTDIYIEKVHCNVKIKCSKNCRIIGVKEDRALTIERGDWDEEVGLKK